MTGPHRPAPSSGSGAGDTLLNLVLGLAGVVLAVAVLLHAAVLTAAALARRRLDVSLADTLSAVRDSPADVVGGYPADAGQLPPAWLVWLLLAGVATVVAGCLWWWAGRRGPRDPDGMATRATLRRALGRPGRRRGRVPTAASAAGGGPSAAAARGMFLAAGPSGPLWARHEDSVFMVAPPRSGKTKCSAVGLVLDAPGPVVTTSTKTDLLELTVTARGRGGPVYVFDPEQISDWPTPVRWNPLDGCQAPDVAVRRAAALVAARPLAGASNTDFFAAAATTVLRCLLLAAALSGASMVQVLTWVNDPTDDEPLEVLRHHPSAPPTWASELTTFTRGGADETTSSVRMTLGLILSSLASPTVLATVCPPTGEGFNVQAFLDPPAGTGPATLFLLAESSSPAAPLVTALADHVVHAAKRASQRLPGGCLDPPLRLVLDEAANIAPLPTLPQLMSDSGGRGITTVVMVQSFAQARSRWGRDGAESLWGAATAKIVLGGLADANDLEAVSRLCGERTVTRTSTTRSGSGGSSTQASETKRVLPAHRLRTLDVGQALILYRTLEPVLVRLQPWWRRRDAEQLRTDAGSVARQSVANDADRA